MKLNENINASNYPEVANKIKIYSAGEIINGVGYNTILNRLLLARDHSTDTILVEDHFNSNMQRMKEYSEQLIVKNGHDDFNYFKIKYNIRYPFADNVTHALSRELEHAFEYHNKEKILNPMYISKKSRSDDPMHYYIYITIYTILLRESSNNDITPMSFRITKAELDRKIKYGYRIIRKTILDAGYRIQLDSRLITAIDEDTKAKYNQYLNTKMTLNNDVARLMDKLNINSIDELEKLLVSAK